MKKPSRKMMIRVNVCVVVVVFLFLSLHHGIFDKLLPIFNRNADNSATCVYVASSEGKPGIITDNGILPQSAKNLSINDVTITVKTGHEVYTRLDNILLTWQPEDKASVIFITDSGRQPLQLRSKSRVVTTSCAADHTAEGLNCKMEAEFEAYMKRRTKWWCHMDDDNYVNTDVLLRLLSKYDSDSDVYIGRPSTNNRRRITWEDKTVDFWFAHGGCGFCVSRALAVKMEKYISGGELRNISLSIFVTYRSNDDVALGFIVNYLLRTKLTVSNLFNSHWHHCELGNLTLQEIKEQATLSYSAGARVRITPDDWNSTREFFSKEDDPSRFFTIHCLLHPETDYCVNEVL